MFVGCSSLTSLDLSHFDTSNVTDMRNMFDGCSSLTTIYCNEDWSEVERTYSGNMFTGCEKLLGGRGTAYDAAHVDLAYARPDSPENPGYFTLNLTPQVILTADRVAYFTNIDATYSAGDTYNGQGVLAAVTIDVYSNVNNQNYFVLRGLTTPVKVIFESSFSNVRPTSTKNWFHSFADLTVIEGLENLNTSNVKTMRCMFYGCSGLTA